MALATGVGWQRSHRVEAPTSLAFTVTDVAGCSDRGRGRGYGRLRTGPEGQYSSSGHPAERELGAEALIERVLDVSVLVHGQ